MIALSDAEILKNIRSNVRNIRIQRGLSQKQVAEELFIAPATVSAWEQGVNMINVPTLIRLADLFHVSVLDICNIYTGSILHYSLDKNAFAPVRAHATDAGLDLIAPQRCVVPAHGFNSIDLGVHIQLPPQTYGKLCSKSGLNVKHGITCDGTIDEGYSGSIIAVLHNSSSQAYCFERGDKVAQLVIHNIQYPELKQVASVSAGLRGDNGFGSTGKSV